MGRRRKFWGWGYEGEGPSPEQQAGMVSVLYRPGAGPPVHPAPDIEVESWEEFSEHLGPS